MLLVDVVGPETRRCRSAWQCVYLVPIDAVDFPTIQKIMLELHKLASIAPSEAFVLVLVNYMHLKVSQHVDEEAARKAWTATKGQMMSHRINELCNCEPAAAEEEMTDKRQNQRTVQLRACRRKGADDSPQSQQTVRLQACRRKGGDD